MRQTKGREVSKSTTVLSSGGEETKRAKSLDPQQDAELGRHWVWTIALASTLLLPDHLGRLRVPRNKESPRPSNEDGRNQKQKVSFDRGGLQSVEGWLVGPHWLSDVQAVAT